jgi:hypothetical protein
VGRGCVDGLRVAGLDELAEVHHAQEVGDVADDGEVVRDDDVREVVKPLQLAHEVEHLRADGDVERGDRFVGHDQLRVERQRPGQPDALSLPARELVCVAVDGVAGQPDLVQQAPDDRSLLAGRAELLNRERLAHDAADAHAGIERRVRILEHELPISVQPLPLPESDLRQVPAGEADRAGRRALQAHDQPADRGLAAAGLADEPESGPGRDVERDARDRVHGAGPPLEEARRHRKLLDDVAELEERSGARHSPPASAASARVATSRG